MQQIWYYSSGLDAGLEAAVFAALVPNSADKPLQELIEEIMGDHEMLVGWYFLTVFHMIFCKGV